MTKKVFLIALICVAVHGNAQPKYNKELAAVLETIYREDQGGRLKIDSLQKIYGWQSEQVQSLLRPMEIADSLNVIKVKSIIDKYGWLGPDDVGIQGAQTIFLVIQHADSLTRVTYFPLMQEAVRKGKADAKLLALMEDRILVEQGKEQIYGSQVKTNDDGKNEFFPIKDEADVNRRRAAIGLQPLEEYAKYFNIIYVLPKAATKN